MVEMEKNKCDFCGCCVGVCPENCIELMEAELKIDEYLCTDCGKCVWACPFKVLSLKIEKRRKDGKPEG